MCNLLYALVFVAASLMADDLNVVVPQDTTPFKVATTDLVSIPGNGIAGSKITFDVDGPAKVERVYSITERAGGRTIIGASKKQAMIKPTSAGIVKVTITVTFPTGADPKVTVYQFEVE